VTRFTVSVLRLDCDLLTPLDSLDNADFGGLGESVGWEDSADFADFFEVLDLVGDLLPVFFGGDTDRPRLDMASLIFCEIEQSLLCSKGIETSNIVS